MIESISKEFEQLVQVKNKSTIESLFEDYRAILYCSLSILGNLCSSPGKDEASTMPRFEIFKVDVFEMSSELIRNVFAVYELYQDCGLTIDLELIDAISFFLRNVLYHLQINP